MPYVAKHNEVGKLGEEIAANFIKKKGLKVVSMNYWKPYGEIDIVAHGTNGKTHFIEVKASSYLPAKAEATAGETGGSGDLSVSHETHRPEENVHPQKMRRLSRVIQSYLISHETDEWQFDVIAVYIDTKARKAGVKWLKDIVIGA